MWQREEQARDWRTPHWVVEWGSTQAHWATSAGTYVRATAACGKPLRLMSHMDARGTSLGPSGPEPACQECAAALADVFEKES